MSIDCVLGDWFGSKPATAELAISFGLRHLAPVSWCTGLQLGLDWDKTYDRQQEARSGERPGPAVTTWQTGCREKEGGDSKGGREEKEQKVGPIALACVVLLLSL
eukprot:jgi/Chlat1/7788/Chrsp66S07333